MDPGRFMLAEFWEDVRALLIGLTAFMPSEDELKQLFKGRTTNTWEMVEEIASWGVNLVVVKCSWKGQMLFDAQNNKRYEISAYPSNMIDPTGAGDVFAGGFLAGYQKTSDALEALLYGNVAASIAVEGSGAFYTQAVLPGLEKARLESLRESVREV
jgi:sugar/nucleoside kinase (ribokinase family)